MSSFFFIPIATKEDQNHEIFQNLIDSGIVNPDHNQTSNYGDTVYRAFRINSEYQDNFDKLLQIKQLAEVDANFIRNESQAEVTDRVLFSHSEYAPEILYKFEQNPNHTPHGVYRSKANDPQTIFTWAQKPQLDVLWSVFKEITVPKYNWASEEAHFYNSVHPESDVWIHGEISIVNYMNLI